MLEDFENVLFQNGGTKYNLLTKIDMNSITNSIINEMINKSMINSIFLSKVMLKIKHQSMKRLLAITMCQSYGMTVVRKQEHKTLCKGWKKQSKLS